MHACVRFKMFFKVLSNYTQPSPTWSTSCYQVEATTWISSLAIVIALLFVWQGTQGEYPKLQRVNSRTLTKLFGIQRMIDFLMHSREILAEGSRRYPDQPYKLFTEVGDVVVIPPKYVEELKNNPKMDFFELGKEDHHSYISGFEPFALDVSFIKVITKHLSKALGRFTPLLSQEVSKAMQDIFKDSVEWSDLTVPQLTRLVSRMSTRVYMGKELSHDEQWLTTTSDYINTLFIEGFKLSFFPRFLRPVAQWFLPGLYQVRQKLKKCRESLKPHLDRRIAVKAEAEARGEPNPYDDALEWFDRELQGNFDPAVIQISLTVVSVHTTSDLLLMTMVDIAKNSEVFHPLREEVISVLREEGLKTAALQKLKLLDSCLKESQRLKPIQTAYFRRKALEDIKLHDGFIIKKGTKVLMDGARGLLNEEEYPNAQQWDPYRYMRMRENPAEANQAHFVSCTTKHYGFGHGLHACPGRFFASHELKVLLAHLLLKYEWEIHEDCRHLEPLPVGVNFAANPEMKLRIRRRQEEIDLNSIAC